VKPGGRDEDDRSPHFHRLIVPRSFVRCTVWRWPALYDRTLFDSGFSAKATVDCVAAFVDPDGNRLQLPEGR
jgi:hypothetical protein